MIIVRLRVSRETRSSSNDLDSLAHGRRCFEKLRLVLLNSSQISWGLQNVHLDSISDGATAHRSFNQMETVLLRPCWLKSPSRTEAQELYEERETRMCGWSFSDIHHARTIVAQRLPESSLHQCFPASSVGNLVGQSKPSSHHLWALPAAARTSKKTSKNLRSMKTAKMRWKDQRLVTVKPWQRYFWCCVTAKLDKHRSIMFFLMDDFWSRF